MYYIEFLKALGIVNKNSEIESRWASGLASRPILESFGSVKYFLDKRQDNPNIKMINDSIAQFGDIKVYKNKYFVPLGFSIDKILTRSEFDKLSNSQKDFTLLKSAFIADEESNNYSELSKFDLKDTLPLNLFTWDVYKNYVDELKKDTLSIESHTQTKIVGSITINKNKLLVLSIPFDKGWNAIVNNKAQEIKIVDAGFSGLILPIGKHTIELIYHPRYTKIGMILSLVGIVFYSIILFLNRKK